MISAEVAESVNKVMFYMLSSSPHFCLKLGQLINLQSEALNLPSPESALANRGPGDGGCSDSNGGCSISMGEAPVRTGNGERV